MARSAKTAPSAATLFPGFRDESGTHHFFLRVYYEDTDAAGVVYYANYLKFAERARTEMMISLDAGYEAMVAGREVAFAVRHCTIDYEAAARLGDVLEITTRITALSGATLGGRQIMTRDGKTLVTLDITLACLNGAGRPVRIPDSIANALKPFLHH